MARGREDSGGQDEVFDDDGWGANRGSAGKLAEFWAHPDEDAYRDERNLLLRVGEVRTPILRIGGWHDPFGQGTLDPFRLLNTEGAPGARAKPEARDRPMDPRRESGPRRRAR